MSRSIKTGEAPPEPSADAPPQADAVRPFGAFPRVELLPDEIAEQARVRRARLVLVGAVAGAAIVVTGLYFSANSEVADAQTELDAQQAVSAQLASQQAELADVPATFATVAAAQKQLSLAMADEIRWSYQLNNIAATIPSGVSLLSYKAVLTTNSAGATTAAPASTDSGVATVDFTGEAKGYPKVAAWLDTLAKQPTNVAPFPGSIALSTDPTHPDVVTFANTSELNDKALSHRYDSQAGS